MQPVRKASNKGKNIIGHFPSLKMKRMINFESLIERDLIYLLDYEMRVEQFCEQPVTIEYQYESKKRRYTPDFHVVYAGRNLLFECKPERFVNDPDNQVKFEAARKWSQEQGWTFGIVTDTLLATNRRVENVKLLTRFARYSISSELKGRIFAFLSSRTEPVKASDLMQATNPAAPQSMLIPILHMAFHHQVHIPLNDAKIDRDFPVALPSMFTEKGLLPI
jgi:hypothetical protein